MDWRDAEAARQRAQQQRDEARFRESMRAQEAEKRAQWAAAERRAKETRELTNQWIETDRRLRAERDYLSSLSAPPQKKAKPKSETVSNPFQVAFDSSAASGTNSSSSTTDAEAAGGVFIIVVVLALLFGWGSHTTSTTAPTQPVHISKYQPTQPNPAFSVENFIQRLMKKGCHANESIYFYCIGALKELKSGKYTVLSCEYNGGMKRYAWSPEAPPNVNHFRDFDPQTISGIDRVGAKTCADLKDGVIGD